MNLAEVHELADAVLLVWYPGEEGGNAVADIVFGKVSPSGRLPLTFPKSLAQLPPYEDYSMKGRTYRFMKEEPLYPFGFGLGYSKFTYSNIKLSATAIKKKQIQPVEVEFTVSNAGSSEGEEVVQLYISALDAGPDAPLYALRGIKRTKISSGSSASVKFTVSPDMMETINSKGESAVLPGRFKVSVGGSLPGSRSEALGAAKSLEAIFTVK